LLPQALFQRSIKSCSFGDNFSIALVFLSTCVCKLFILESTEILSLVITDPPISVISSFDNDSSKLSNFCLSTTVIIPACEEDATGN